MDGDTLICLAKKNTGETQKSIEHFVSNGEKIRYKKLKATVRSMTKNIKKNMN